MKKSIIRLSSELLVLLTLIPSSAFAAKLVGKVQTVKGEAFIVEGSSTRSLRADMDINEGAKLLVGDGAKVTVSDFFDGRHHLSAGTHLTMQTDGFTLQKGAVWTQMYSGKSQFATATANMIVWGRKGEWIITYDVARRRTQLTTITGEVDVASPQEPAFKYAVSAGMFSMADTQVEDGYPRSPTKLGYDSLMKTLAVFPGVKSQDAGLAQVQKNQPQQPSRSIASSSGKIIFIRTIEKNGRMPASIEGQAHQYFSHKTKKVAKRPVSYAPVRVIGYQSVRVKASRLPASKRKIQPQARAPRTKDSEFLKSYKQHQLNQPTHSQEVQSLVDDLKSF